MKYTTLPLYIIHNKTNNRTSHEREIVAECCLFINSETRLPYITELNVNHAEKLLQYYAEKYRGA